jgi:hypothetical protein
MNPLGFICCIIIRPQGWVPPRVCVCVCVCRRERAQRSFSSPCSSRTAQLSSTVYVYECICMYVCLGTPHKQTRSCLWGSPRSLLLLRINHPPPPLLLLLLLPSPPLLKMIDIKLSYSSSTELILQIQELLLR